jgi:hypothetical protein
MEHLHRRITPPDTKRQVGSHSHPGGDDVMHTHREQNLHEVLRPDNYEPFTESLTQAKE